MIEVRQAQIEDTDMLFELRNDPATIAGSRSKKPVEWDKHKIWIAENLTRDDRVFLIGIIGEMPACGLVWFGLNRGNVWETSVSLSAVYRGQGIGSMMLSAAMKWMASNRGATEFSTEIGDDNIAAIKMYERCKFRFIHPSPGFGTYFASGI